MHHFNSIKASNKFWRVAALTLLLVGMTQMGAADSPLSDSELEETYDIGSHISGSLENLGQDEDYYYAFDNSDYQVHRFDKDWNYIETVFTFSSSDLDCHDNPFGFYTDGETFFIGDYSPSCVYEFDENGNRLDKWDISSDHDNLLGLHRKDTNDFEGVWHVIDYNIDEIKFYDDDFSSTGESTDLYGGGHFTGFNIRGIWRGEDWAFIADTTDDRVVEYDSSWTQTGEATASGETGNGVIVDRDSEVLFSTSRDGVIHEYSLNLNEPPEFDSVESDPSPPQINRNVSYSADLVDPDDDSQLEEVELELEYGGETVYQDTRSVSGDSDSAEWLDVFVPEQTDQWLNATFTASDTAGDSTTESLNYFLDDTPPEVSIVSPENQTYWSYDVPYEVEVDADNDSVPDQEFDLELYSDGVLVESLSGSGTETFTGEFTQDLGEGLVFEASASDTGGSGTESVEFSVNDLEITGTDFTGTVFETEDTSYQAELMTGDMVDEAEVKLNYGEDLQSVNENVEGVTSVESFQSYRPRLVGGESENRDFNFEIVYERDTVGGSSENVSVESELLSQSVEKAFRPDGISPSFDFGQSSRTVERHPFDVSLDYSSEDVSEVDVGVDAETTFENSSFSGLSGVFTPGNVEGSTDENIESSLLVSFKDDEKSREFEPFTVTVDEVVLNTDGVGEPVLNVEILDEEDTTSVDSDVDFNFDTTTNEGVLDKNFGFELSETSSFTVSLDPGYAEVLVDGVIRYDSEGYRSRRYEVRNQSLEEPALDLDLYIIDDVVGEPVYFEVVDAAGDPVNGILETQRYSESSNSFRTVSRTGINNGEALAYLNIDDVFYRHQVRDDQGEVLQLFDRRLITCSTIPCERVLQIGDDVIPFEQQRRGFDFTCDALVSEGMFNGVQCDVSHEDDIMQGAELVLERGRGLGTTTVCTSETSSPGQLICELEEGEEVEGYRYSYRLTGFTNDFSYVLESDSFDFTERLFQGQAPFLAVIVFLSISLLGLRNYGTAVMFSVMGVFVGFGLGLLQVSAASVAGLFIVGLFYLFMHSRL